MARPRQLDHGVRAGRATSTSCRCCPTAVRTGAAARGPGTGRRRRSSARPARAARPSRRRRRAAATAGARARPQPGRAASRAATCPAVYLEHNAPEPHPVRSRAPARRPRPTSRSCTSPTSTSCSGTPAGRRRTVIEHGVVDPGERYTGELAARRGRRSTSRSAAGAMVGTDLLPGFAATRCRSTCSAWARPAPSPAACGTRGRCSTRRAMHAELARRRVYLHPMRWTSLGPVADRSHAPRACRSSRSRRPRPSRRCPPGRASCRPTSPRLVAGGARRYARRPGSRPAGGQGRARRTRSRATGLARFLRDWDALFEEVTR